MLIFMLIYVDKKGHHRWPQFSCSHPWEQGSWGQHGANLGPTGPRWAPCWPHELCYLGCYWLFGMTGPHHLWLRSTNCDNSVLQNQRKYKYIYMFPRMIFHNSCEAWYVQGTTMTTEHILDWNILGSYVDKIQYLNSYGLEATKLIPPVPLT